MAGHRRNRLLSYLCLCQISQRKGLTNEQRRQLRAFSAGDALRPSQKQCIEWFQAKFDRCISQATVSDSLSSQYSFLDSQSTAESRPLNARSARLSQWPEVEKIHLEWQETFQPSDLRYLGDIEDRIAGLSARSRVQNTLDRWLS